jgi:hypothetical protein
MTCAWSGIGTSTDQGKEATKSLELSVAMTRGVGAVDFCCAIVLRTDLIQGACLCVSSRRCVCACVADGSVPCCSTGKGRTRRRGNGETAQEQREQQQKERDTYGHTQGRTHVRERRNRRKAATPLFPHWPPHCSLRYGTETAPRLAVSKSHAEGIHCEGTSYPLACPSTCSSHNSVLLSLSSVCSVPPLAFLRWAAAAGVFVTDPRFLAIPTSNRPKQQG